LSEAIENDDFGVNRLKALSLMADVLGMKRSGIDVAQADTRSSETILAELRAKLSSLTELGLIDGVINHDDDMTNDAVVESDASSEIRH
jgi:predicted transcriptional regulator